MTVNAEQRKKNDGGYIVVETVLGFMLFAFLMVSILTLVNIVALQHRVHYAITRTAQDLSNYSYVLEVTGTARVIKDTSAKSSLVKGKVSEFQSDLGTLIDGISNLDPSSISSGYTGAADQIDEWIQNPKQTLMDFLTVGVDGLKDAVVQDYLIEPLFKQYLATGNLRADDYLERNNVIGGLDGMSFNDSIFIDSKGDITIVVTYQIKYEFGALPLPFKALTVTQTAKTRAWLDGDGTGYVNTGKKQG